MADITALLAGAAKTNANFNFDELGKSYWQGLEDAYKQRQRDLFKDGVPRDANGEIDWNAASAAALQSGGAGAIGPAVEVGKMTTELAIKKALQQGAGIFDPNRAGAEPQPTLPPSVNRPGIVQSAPAANDRTGQRTDNMTIAPAQVAAANAPRAVPQAAPVTPPQPQAQPQIQPQQQTAQLPPPPPSIVPRPVQTERVLPQQQAAPQQAAPPAPPQQVPPQAMAQQTVPPIVANAPPEVIAQLRASGLLPGTRSLAQHVQFLQQMQALAQSTGQRDAGKPYSDALTHILKVLNDHTAPTESQRDYNRDVEQGYAGTYTEWRQGKEARAVRMDVDKDTMKEIGLQAAQMKRVEPLLQEALRISANTHAGYAGILSPYWAKVVSSFGINPSTTTTNTEALKSIAQQLVPLVRQPGATSNYEAALYLDAVISPGLSHEARVKVGNLIVKMVQRAQDVAKVYRANVGREDLYDKIAELDKKPMFNPAEKALLEAAAKATQAEAAKTTAADAGKDQAVDAQSIVDELRRRQLAK